MYPRPLMLPPSWKLAMPMGNRPSLKALRSMSASSTDHRRGGHRRDHLLYQHLQPERADGGRFTGEERRRKRADQSTLGEDFAGAGLESGDRVSQCRRADALSRKTGF